jgi:hypothetical protein
MKAAGDAEAYPDLPQTDDQLRDRFKPEKRAVFAAMKQWDDYPAPIAASYAYGAKDEAIMLYEGGLEIAGDAGVLAEGTGRVTLRWLPNPAPVFELPDAVLRGQMPDHARMRGVPDASEADVFVTHHSGFGRGTIRGVINSIEFAPAAPMVEVRFLVANLLGFTGDSLLVREPDGQSWHAWRGRVVALADDWTLTLDSRPDHPDVTRRLRDEGGIDVTHTACLDRRDGLPFDARDAADLLHATASFLGFVRGAWAPPLLAVGMDSHGKVVWQDWTRRHTSRWNGRLSAFDERHGEYLDRAFRGYMKRWRQDLWNEPLRVVTQMYVEANGPITVDTSTLLAQAALELIAWVRFVEELKTRREADFDRGTRASDRLRELLGWLEVDPSIPSSLDDLSREASRLGWEDGPHAVTDMRNALVHPRIRDRLMAPSMAAKIELNELALSYCELALLRLIDFDGEYANRLGSRMVGVVEPVPWCGS